MPKGKRRRPGRQDAARTASKPFVLSRNHSRALLFLILLFAAFLRLYQLDTFPPGLYADEAMDGNNALQALETGHFQVFYPENHGREGLFINLTAASVHFFGNTAWAVRFTTAIFGILTVWVVYVLADEFFSPPIGLLAAFFTATGLWQMIASRFSNRANAPPFLLALALYFLLAAVKRLRQGKPYAGRMLLAGAVYGLGFHTYIAYRATPLLIGALLFYWFLQARKEGWLGAFWKASVWFAAAAAAIVGPLLIYFVQHPNTLVERASQVSVFNEPHPVLEVGLNIWKMAQMFFFTGDANWRHNISGRRELFWPVAILFAVGIAMAVGAVRGSIRRRPVGSGKPESCFPYAVALGWMVVGALPVIFSNDGVPHAHRSLIMLPPVFMLTAAGGYRAYGYLSRMAPRGWRIAAVAAFFLILCCEPYYMYFHVWAANPNVPKEFDASIVGFAAKVNAVPREVPKYIAIARNTNLVNGIPIELQTAVFLTKSFTKREQEETNIHYVTPPPGAKVEARAFCAQVVEQQPHARVFCLQ